MGFKVTGKEWIKIAMLLGINEFKARDLLSENIKKGNIFVTRIGDTTFYSQI